MCPEPAIDRYDYGRKLGYDQAAQSRKRIVHMPEGGTGLLSHADTISGVAGRSLAIDRPAGKELFLHFEIEFKPAAAENHPFFRLDVIGLACHLCPDTGNFLRRQLNQLLCRSFVQDFHVPLSRLVP